MERRWIILIAAGALIIVTLIVGLVIHTQFHKDHCTNYVCQTPECVQAAAQILNHIDVNVDPCYNFYNFVCGKFLKTAEILDDMKEISTVTIANDELQKQLKGALEEPVELSELNAFQLLKSYHQACINTESIERRGLKPLRELLKEIGGWPVLEDQIKWENKNLDWYYYIYKFRQLGLGTNHFISMEVQNDLKNSTFHILQLDQPTLALPKEYFLDGAESVKYIEEYRRFMVNVAVYLGADEFRAAVELRDVLNLEKKLANISVGKEEPKNISGIYNIMTIKELEREYSSIPWLEYVNNLITPNYLVTEQERILVLVPEYFAKLDALLQKTPKRDQINYLVWKSIASIIPYLTEDLREMEFKYQSGTYGIVEKLPRWKQCLQHTYKSFPIALSSFYVRSFFNEDLTVSAESIVRSVKQEYVDTLEVLDWMDEKTRKIAAEKAYKIDYVIGFPDELLEDAVIEEMYNEEEIDSTEFLQSHLKINKMNEDFRFKRLRMLKEKTAWLTHGTIVEVDAFYSTLTNTITLAAGILQVQSYLNPRRPNYLNYGGLGFVIAHEITHAFDSTGRLFDENGNMNDWWGRKSEDFYSGKMECIVEQYGNYTIAETNLTINEVNTLEDNVADNVGIKHAYGAYLKWIEKNGMEQDLPGLYYTPNQLFWISFALNQCTKQRHDQLLLDMATNTHSPPEFRVDGSLSNLPEFAKDFNCPADSPMRSENICVLW